MAITGLYNESVVILRASRVTDDMGGVTPAWSQVGADVACCIQAMSGGERAIRGQNGVEATHKMWLGSGVDIKEADEVRASDGSRFYVTYRDDFQRRAHHQTVELLEQRSAV